MSQLWARISIAIESALFRKQQFGLRYTFILQDGTSCGNCFCHGFDLCGNSWLRITVLRKCKERHEPGTASQELTELWTGESRHLVQPAMCSAMLRTYSWCAACVSTFFVLALSEELSVPSTEDCRNLLWLLRLVRMQLYIADRHGVTEMLQIQWLIKTFHIACCVVHACDRLVCDPIAAIYVYIYINIRYIISEAE